MPTGNHSSPARRRAPVGRFSFGGSPPAGRNGFTYIGILIAISILGVALASTGVIWHTAQQRERERELLFVGGEFRHAIGRYYTVGAGVGALGQYPQRLDDLLRDPRRVGVARYLRKIYYDPITGSQKWGLVKNSNGRIIGVYSLSDATPIKQDHFDPDDQYFKGKKKYSQWTFIYSPKQNRPAAAPIAPGTPGTPAPASKGSQ